ncbi:SDR family NAD(P)-dependent oxidoreductase [Streptomyces sp. NPDC003077]|uniref:SDR family NAD(P)-dependent oxidoreductase n=1 Tax=Streptomyces sp. NPDC003077 TaxID=3154443 RepID=UPI0033AC9942
MPYDTPAPAREEPVAVVGVSCRLPGGVSSLDDLWQVLAEGRDVVSEVPADRFETARFVDTSRPRDGKSYTAAGGFLEDIGGFDGSFFSHISPREAEWLDPQQRILLELAVEAIDDAGIAAGALAGTDTAVYVGVSSHDYLDLQTRRPRRTSPYAISGGAAGNTANRVSHLFDLHGPSLAVDTACSSALTAVHEACERIRSGGSRLALAGGINILLSPYAYAGFSAASMLSPTGRCRAFSAQADGFVRAEGGGVVVLKRLSDALADGDRIHAVVLGSGTNSDGTTPGLAVPDQDAQRALLREVYARAGVAPDDLAYLEAHGTGTRVGDPIECRAIGAALGSPRRDGDLPIGSVKSNLGHLEAASGMAGLCKALLVLRERVVPPTLHAEPLNPDIDFAALRLRPALKPVTLTRPPRAVGVNSFGFGGANAHILLGPAPESVPPAPGPVPDELPVLVSARTPRALGAAAVRLADRLEDAGPADGFYDLAHTAVLRRGHHPHRAVVLASRPGEAAHALRALAEGGSPAGGATAEQTRRGAVAFAFSGNGSQWAGMGADLLGEPAFRDAVDAVDAALAPHLGWSVREALAAPPEGWRLERTAVAQPLLFATQLGLVALLETHGLRPGAVVGHSVGETAAAYVSGALTLPDAAAVVAARSRAQQTTAGAGRMAAVGLSEDEIRAELAAFDGALELAGVNSPQDVTVTGDPRALAALEERVRERGAFFRALDLDYAFHGRAMDPITEPLRAELAGLRPGPARLPFASAVTGALAEGGTLDAGYWVRNVREPVRFADAVRALRAEGCDVFVEIGPHPVLGGYLRRLAARESEPVAVIATCRRGGEGGGGPAEVRTCVAHAIAAGAPLDWERAFPRPGRVVDLPAYPWQRERHWRGRPQWWDGASDGPGEDTAEAGGGHPLLGTRLTELEPVWTGPLETGRLPWLADHKVGAAVVFPAAAYVETALAAGRRLFDAPAEAGYLDLERALVLPGDDEGEVWLQTSYSEDDQGLRIAARADEHAAWRTHARGRLRRLLASAPPPLDAGAVRDRCPERWEGAEHYAYTARSGLPYGPAFRVLRELRVGRDEVLASYATDVPEDGCLAHPVILDGALQAGAPLLARFGGGEPFLPVAIERVRMWHTPSRDGLVHVVGRESGTHEACWDITVAGPDGRVALELTGCRLRRYAGEERTGTPVRWLEPALRARSGAVPEAAPRPVLTAAALRDASAGPPPALVAEGAAAHGFTARFEEFGAHFTARALAGLAPAGADFTLADLVAAGLRPEYERLAALLLGLARRHGLAASAGEGVWRLTGTPRPEQALRDTLERHPGHAMVAALFARCGQHLPDVLRGHTDPLELLFGEADQHVLEHFYGHHPALGADHRRAVGLVRALVERWPADRPLRVLEVGGGTGAMTAALLPELPADRTAYVFTDVSASFFTRAQARFATYDNVEYRPLDLDADPREQGFEDGAFDLVVAGNVLHATADLRRTLSRVRGLLAEDGLLLAMELHDSELLAPCFGLLDSFWTYTDTGLRTATPLLPAAAWESLLAECGFADTVRLNSDADEEDVTAAGRHSLLLARRTGPAPARSTPLPVGSHDHWLVLAERPGSALATRLAACLGEATGRPVPVTAPEAAPGAWADRVPEDARAPHVVLLLDEDTPARPEDTLGQAVRRTGVLRALATDCARLAATATPALTLVTRPCGVLPGPDAPEAPGDAVAWGVARTLANEQPSASVCRLALRRGPDAGPDARRLARELLAPDGDEDELLLTPGGRFAARVVDHRPRPRPDGGARTAAPRVLRVDTPGTRHRLHWEETPATPPGPGEVAIAVRAAALNYRDVMVAVGIYPPGGEHVTEDGIALGLECAGEVTEVGEGVTHLAPGDRVYTLGRSCLATRVIARADQTGVIPDGMTFAQAATLPVVFYTVHHSLARLAHLAPHETLLVHGAAGGIGLAALQYARAQGSPVVATAGTPGKRDLLRLLGADHVLDSRTLEFADRITELTGGVDVVLNSLAGEAIPRSLELLRPGGRFVELGKRDIYAATPLMLRPFRNNLAYFGVDAHQLITDGLPLADGVFAEVAEAVAAGRYRPLPHQAYPADRADEAFREMRRSHHLGKVVLTFDAPPPPSARPVPAATRPLADLAGDGTVLITGGLGGFGAATAVHLARRGVRHLALAGRHGDATPGSQALLSELAALGATATAYAADVTDPDRVRDLLREIDASGHPLRGVVHGAMVLDDAPLTELTDRRVRDVLAPKLLGALLLDEAVRGRDLGFFVGYSSGSGTLGNVHQAPYAAGNLFLEALTRARRRAGAPALALVYGPVSDAGYVARKGLTDALAQRGWAPVTTDEAFAAFDTLLGDETPVVLIDRSDWHRVRRMLPSVGAPRFVHLLPSHEAGDAAAGHEELRRRLAEADPGQAHALMCAALAEVLSAVLHHPADSLDPARPLDQLGVDSLMASELSQLLRRRTGCDISPLEINDAGTIAALAHRVLARLGYSDTGRAPQDATAP